MWVRFKSGTIRKGGEELQAFWAESNLGSKIKIANQPLSQMSDAFEILSEECVTSFELPGIRNDDAEFLIDRILDGNYLEKPGTKGKGDAVLYMLVNEALHELARIGDEDLKIDGGDLPPIGQTDE
jgi:hypothetical protein